MKAVIGSRLEVFNLSRINEFFILGFITLFAVGLRFYKLGEWSFWYDEIFTLRDVQRISELGLLDQQISRALIYLTVHSLGISEWSARLVPALVGALTIPALYFPLRRIFNPNVALLSGLLLAVSPWHLYWSQNARFYTTILLFYTLALLVFYFGIEKDRPWYLFLFLFLVVLAVQERLFALFLLPVAAGYLLLLKILPFDKPPGLRLRNVLILIIPVLAGGLIIGWKFISELSQWMIGFGWVNNNPAWIFSGVVYYVGLPIMVMGTLAGVYLIARKKRIALLLVLSAVIPLVGIMTLSVVQYAANRYAFISLTSWVILAAVAAWELLVNSTVNVRVLAIGALLLLVVEPLSEDILYYRYQNGNRDDWKSALAFIDRVKDPMDKVVVTNTMLAEYYLKKPTIDINAINVEELPNQGERVWFVEDMNLGDKTPKTLRWIKANTTLMANFDVHVRARNFIMRIYLFDPNKQ
ncbi:MAG TPA: glycosyltransferase family 39 protein [Anaerolineales bacterium]|nr:glycosyltransferase family 39 protein [Anaerolineales bacterium]